MSHTIAIFPGSFDPFTRGHQALVDDALRIFDKVVIGIGNNVSKAGLLRIEARKQLIEDLYADNPRVKGSNDPGKMAMVCDIGSKGNENEYRIQQTDPGVLPNVSDFLQK
jgi:cytidyltransferase-like protein